MAEKPALRQLLEKHAASELNEAKKVREADAEAQNRSRALTESLAEAPALIERLRPLKDTLVTMENTAIQKWRSVQLPAPVGELPPALKIKQARLNRMKL